MLVCEGIPGEHISNTAQRAIDMAARYNRKVRFVFNGVKLCVNKRLSEKHVVRTLHAMLDAAFFRSRRSPEGKRFLEEQRALVLAKQERIDELVVNLPRSKVEAIGWLAKWVPLVDDRRVKNHIESVLPCLRDLGFVADQHAYYPFVHGSDPMVRAEYIAGQVVSELESGGIVYPLLGIWAEEVAMELGAGVSDVQ